MADVIFPEGIRVFTPRENAPKWIKAQLVVDIPKFIAWLESRNDGSQIRLDLNKSDKGTLYLKLNTWKPNKKGEAQKEVDEFEAL